MFKILVVDDDEQMQFFLKEALEREPYSVTIAGSGAQALERLAGSQFDLVLLDIRLPDTSGLELVGEILQFDQRLPIIMMTAHGTRDTAIEAMRRGAYDYFTKPFRLDELEIVVR